MVLLHFGMVNDAECLLLYFLSIRVSSQGRVCLYKHLLS